MAEQLGVRNSDFLLSLHPAYFPSKHSAEKWAVGPNAALHLGHGTSAATLIGLSLFLN